MKKTDWKFRASVVFLAIAGALWVSELQRFRSPAPTFTEELNHRLSVAENQLIPDTVCVDDELNVPVRQSLPAVPELGMIVFHWPQRALLVGVPQPNGEPIWYMMLGHSYTWNPGRCE